MQSFNPFWSPMTIPKQTPFTTRFHSCPYCQCSSAPLASNLGEHSPQLCMVSRFNPQNLPIKQFQNTFILRGENIQDGKVILSRSISPYTKKIIMRYESPKNRTGEIKIVQENRNGSYSKQNKRQPEGSEPIRPKILDRKKAKAKQNNIRISFKSVKSASTDLFLETPAKKLYEGECQRYGSTDETDSVRSLSKVSIDERFFQQ